LQLYTETDLEQDMEIKSLKESEKEHLLNVLMKTHWDLEKTSRLLKISLNRLKSKIKEYDIRRPDPQGS
jgi:DNA-binding NtrC family response regulator